MSAAFADGFDGAWVLQQRLQRWMEQHREDLQRDSALFFPQAFQLSHQKAFPIPICYYFNTKTLHVNYIKISIRNLKAIERKNVFYFAD